MAVKIRLKRMGKIRTAIYRVVVMDSRTKRDGRAIEEIGKYDPNQHPSLVDIDMERADYWLGQGAQPTEAVAALLKLYKDGTLQVAEPKKSKKELYEAALAAAGKAADDDSAATTPRKRAAKKAEEPKADELKAEEPKADEPKADEPKADEPKAEEPKAEEPKAEEVAPAADTDSGAASTKSTDVDADAAPAALVDLPEGAAAALEDGSAPEGFTIKGNLDSMKYHEPDGQWYDQTIAEVWFKSAADAEAAGFVKAGA